MTAAALPLHGLTIVDLTRNAPGPYATQLLARLGARIIVVTGGPVGEALPELSYGKTQISLDLRTESARLALRGLLRSADVFVESFRPGVVERWGLTRAALDELNPRLVHCSLTGYGHGRQKSDQAGHDINYLAATGVLGSLGPVVGPPLPPLNLVADMAGGGLWAAFAILAALHERERTGRGHFVDAAMVDGVLSMMGMWKSAWGSSVLPARGRGLVSGEAPFYRCYECADSRWVAVGAIEPKFFAEFWKVLEIGGPTPNHLDQAGWGELTQVLANAIKGRSRDEWAALATRDSCLSPVLDPGEVSTLVGDSQPEGFWLGEVAEDPMADDTIEILREFGLPEEVVSEVSAALSDFVSPQLEWPPV